MTTSSVIRTTVFVYITAGVVRSLKPPITIPTKTYSEGIQKTVPTSKTEKKLSRERITTFWNTNIPIQKLPPYDQEKWPISL
ncbi:hypothetical protein QW060_12390 [Myroides ceti]|uniref:Uncharacterized protein n=1 Tax=Paenimyroides ceti TaxID=395087 RepID=A0ABT8CWG4_9FLAO|nr:hypothetical protein [Paenimyroides ceti]MDN3707907.1 hypothetical protein [Paenimyroides ceti]